MPDPIILDDKCLMICCHDAGAEDGLQQLPAAQDRPAAAGADPQRLGVHPVRALQLGQALPQAGAAGGAYTNTVS